MRPHVDRILCVLPFEVAELERLKGPPGTYVGHRLTRHAGVAKAAAMQAQKALTAPDSEKTLLLLPGSRRSEVRSLIGVFGQTVSLLKSRGTKLRLLLPTVPHVRALVEAETADWQQKPEIRVGQDGKWEAFGQADAALAASGTVSLELALSNVPMVSCYRIDRAAQLIQSMVTVWSASLPNLIADRPVVPEVYNQYVRPGYLARTMEGLLSDTQARGWQLDGFAEVRRRMATERPSGELAAQSVLDEISRRKA